MPQHAPTHGLGEQDVPTPRCTSGAPVQPLGRRIEQSPNCGLQHAPTWPAQGSGVQVMPFPR